MDDATNLVGFDRRGAPVRWKTGAIRGKSAPRRRSIPPFCLVRPAFSHGRLDGHFRLDRSESLAKLVSKTPFQPTVLALADFFGHTFAHGRKKLPLARSKYISRALCGPNSQASTASTRPSRHDRVASSASSSALIPSSMVVRTGVPLLAASRKCSISSA